MNAGSPGSRTCEPCATHFRAKRPHRTLLGPIPGEDRVAKFNRQEADAEARRPMRCVRPERTRRQALQAETEHLALSDRSGWPDLDAFVHACKRSINSGQAVAW